ncbi:MAG: F0F1 ATP synthase subunit gamma [Desulfurivibrionaceae bacterium]|nr:F0F1 ATP synthase subunit gamma [Desulfurivibrionaceae bacterium]
MSETLGALRRKMQSAGKLQAVVRTMKALAASSIGQYERAVQALTDYDRTVEMGLIAFFRRQGVAGGGAPSESRQKRAVGVVVFGSDQGLVGKFNEALVDFTVETLGALAGEKKVWAVGERLHMRLEDAGLPPTGGFVVPNSVTAITPLVAEILTTLERQRSQGEINHVYLFYNRPQAQTLYDQVSQRLLPLDDTWRRDLSEGRWPTRNLPQLLVESERTLAALIREYLFVSLFKACAESLASENASRLAAMQRAEKNIEELLEELGGTFHRLRQSGIDEELFDVISGYESLGFKKR